MTNIKIIKILFYFFIILNSFDWQSISNAQSNAQSIANLSSKISRAAMEMELMQMYTTVYVYSKNIINDNNTTETNKQKAYNLLSILKDYLEEDLKSNLSKELFRYYIDDFKKSCNMIQPKIFKKNNSFRQSPSTKTTNITNNSNTNSMNASYQKKRNAKHTQKKINIVTYNKSYSSLTGYITASGMRQNNRYMLSIQGDPFYPTTKNISGRYCSSNDTVYPVGYCDVMEIKSNSNGIIKTSFTKKFPPGKYKVDILVKDIQDNYLVIYIQTDNYFEIVKQYNNNTKKEISLFILETATIESIKIDIIFDKNCCKFVNISCIPKKFHFIKFPFSDLESGTIKFDIEPTKNEKLLVNKGLLFKFDMGLEKNCDEANISIVRSFLNDKHTEKVAFFHNEEYTHDITLKHID